MTVPFAGQEVGFPPVNTGGSGGGITNTANAAESVPEVATIVTCTCVPRGTLDGAVYVALVALLLERVPFGFPNPASRVQLTFELLEAETVTVIDCPPSMVGLELGVTN
jgi:hypothetical protein